MKDFITTEVLSSLEFHLTKYEESDWKIGVFYGTAESLFPKGMTIINWNTRGCSCTYNGDKLQPNIAISVMKDGGTRTVFNGYIFNEEQLKTIINLTL